MSSAPAFAQSLSRGEDHYDRHCRSCHGPNLRTTHPERDLRARVTYGLPAFIAIVRSGRPARPGQPMAMPALTAAEISDRALCDVYLYARGGAADPGGACSLPPPPAPPPPAPPEAPTPPSELPAPPTPEAIVAGRRYFPPPAGGGERATFICQGGRSVTLVASNTAPLDPANYRGNWLVQANFTLSERTAYRPGQCLWTSEGRPRMYRIASFRPPTQIRFRWGMRTGVSLAFSSITINVTENGATTALADDGGEIAPEGVYSALGESNALIAFGGTVMPLGSDNVLEILVDEAAASRGGAAPP